MILFIFRFGFEGGILVLIAPVPGHCLLGTFIFKTTHIEHMVKDSFKNIDRYIAI